MGACPTVGRMSLVRVGQRPVLRDAYRDVIVDKVQDPWSTSIEVIAGPRAASARSMGWQRVW